MLSPIQLSLALAVTVVAGTVGVASALVETSREPVRAVQLSAELDDVFAKVARSHPEGAREPLSAAALGPLPTGITYCPGTPVSIAKGRVFAILSNGPNRAQDSSCAEALLGKANADDGLRLGMVKDTGPAVRAASNTDWLPEGSSELLAPGQLVVEDKVLRMMDDAGQVETLAGGGYQPFKLTCPTGTALILGSYREWMLTTTFNNNKWYLPSFCVETYRTDLNLTQAEAERDCFSRGRKLISDLQFSYISQGVAMTLTGGNRLNNVDYSVTEAGLSGHPNWTSTESVEGLPRGSDVAAFGPGGNDPNAYANPIARRRWRVPMQGAVSSGEVTLWDLAGKPQWTSTQVGAEDIGKDVAGVTAAQWRGYPDTSNLQLWSSEYAAAGLPTSFPNGVKDIGYLLTPSNSCAETLFPALKSFAHIICRLSPYNTKGYRKQEIVVEQKDIGWGGYYASTAKGVPLGIVRGGAWPGTRMSSGVYAMAIVPTTERASHRCVIAPSELLAR